MSVNWDKLRAEARDAEVVCGRQAAKPDAGSCVAASSRAAFQWERRKSPRDEPCDKGLAGLLGATARNPCVRKSDPSGDEQLLNEYLLSSLNQLRKF